MSLYCFHSIWVVDVVLIFETRSHYVTPAGLDLPVQLRLPLNVHDPPVVISEMLELKACTSMSDFILFLY